MNNVVKLGLLLSGVGIVSLLITRYILGIEILFSVKQILLSFALIAVIMIIGGRKLLRDPERGRLSYGEAVKGLFIALMISSAISLVSGVLILEKDEEVKKSWAEYQINSQDNAMAWGMKMAGASEAQREEELLKNVERRASGELKVADYPYSWAMIPTNFAISALMYLFFALFLALFVKEKDTGIA